VGVWSGIGVVGTPATLLAASFKASNKAR